MSTNGLTALAEKLIEPKDRTRFAELVAYASSLPEGDEMRRLTEMLGLLSLIGERIPAAAGELITELRAHSEQLAGMPGAVAAELQPNVMAKALAESLRQQLTQTGLHESAKLLQAASITIKSLNAEIAANLKPLSEQISEQTTSLVAAAQRLKQFQDTAAVPGGLSRTLLLVLFFVVFMLGGLAGYLVRS